MDTGTFYLYEYENNVRKRNAGFLKIYRRYQSCIFRHTSEASALKMFSRRKCMRSFQGKSNLRKTDRSFSH